MAAPRKAPGMLTQRSVVRVPSVGARGLMLRLFLAADGLAHRLHRRHLRPGVALGWICDRFDLWLGVDAEEL